MYAFSDYLRDLISKNNITISALSRKTGLERTTLSRVLSGQRTLAYTGLNTIISQLKLSAAEEKELRYYYEKQFERKDIQKSRKIIDNMFSNLTNLDFNMPAFEKRELLLNVEQYAKKQSIFKGNIKVQSLLRVVISEEMTRTDAKIKMTIPPQYGFINEELFRRYIEENIQADITQIMAFEFSEKSEEANLHNLEYFCQVLPFCLLSGQKYHPYYYWGNEVQHHCMDPFPYFLLTHSCVVCLSENGNEALLLREEEQVLYFRRYFQKIMSQCKSLVSYTTDPIEVLNAYAKCTGTDGFYVIMDQPCFGCFYEDEFIDQHIHQDLPYREVLLEAAKKRFAPLRKEKEFYTIFTQSGIKRFMETGTLDDFSTAFVKPFEPEVRKWLLTETAEKTSEGHITARIMEQNMFPEYLCMITSSKKKVGFFATRKLAERNGNFSVHLEEPSLCNEFQSWLLNLVERNKVLSMEETVELLETTAKRPGCEHVDSAK